jgi:hypothetical protein
MLQTVRYSFAFESTAAQTTLVSWMLSELYLKKNRIIGESVPRFPGVYHGQRFQVAFPGSHYFSIRSLSIAEAMYCVDFLVGLPDEIEAQMISWK